MANEQIAQEAAEAITGDCGIYSVANIQSATRRVLAAINLATAEQAKELKRANDLIEKLREIVAKRGVAIRNAITWINKN
jgi:hypothetical protein